MSEQPIQFYLQIDTLFPTIQGSPLPNAVRLSSFTLPASNPDTPSGTGGIGAGRPTIGPVTFTRAIDAQSPHLLLQLLQGKPLTHLTITGILPAKPPVGPIPPPSPPRITYEFGSAFLTGWTHDSVTSSERLTASFASVSVSFAAGHSLSGVNWDLRTNSGGEFTD